MLINEIAGKHLNLTKYAGRLYQFKTFCNEVQTELTI